LRGFEELVKGRGATYVRLNSRVERTSAHAFYERQGYVSDKQQKRFIKAL
jgi:ribosomal protein S18 acetylase RimI-like enzyme